MTRDRFDVLERFAPLFETPEPSFERFLRRRDRKLRNQRIAAGVVAVAILAPLSLFAGLISSDRVRTPATTRPTLPALTGVPQVDYVIDLNTAVMTPVPDAISGSLAGFLFETDYAVSPDGSTLAYVGAVDARGDGQIFITDIDGTGVRQVTHDPNGAFSPVWSPDGTRIAYVGFGSGHAHLLSVVDVASGESRQILRATNPVPDRDVLRLEPQFTPDGSSLLYTWGFGSHPEIRTVPLTGGKSTRLIGPEGNLTGAWNGSVSPDGSMVTFLGSRVGRSEPERWVANADGTERRLLPAVYGIPCYSNPARTWSPDGSRIVCSEASRIVVVDIATGEASPVAQGRGAIWLDDHTLLVSV
jgi:Tol biopolymer transport system component